MKYGCLYEIPSIRTYTYDAVCGASGVDLPESFILPEDRIPPVSDQGNVGACVAFAIAEILYVFNHLERNEKEQFSEGFIYGYNRKASYRGMNPQSTLDLMLKTGSVPKKYYNELYEMPEMQKKLLEDPNLSKLVEIAEKYRIKGYVGLGFHGNDEDELKRALYEAQIPLLGISTDYFRESHAIIIIGWDKDGFIIQNSWGKKWGKNGRKTIPFSAVNHAFLLIDEVFELKFKDVSKDAWYYDAVKEAVFNGLMQGTSEDTFEPDRYPTRAELAQFGVNLCKKIDDRLDMIMAMIKKEA